MHLKIGIAYYFMSIKCLKNKKTKHNVFSKLSLVREYIIHIWSFFSFKKRREEEENIM